MLQLKYIFFFELILRGIFALLCLFLPGFVLWLFPVESVPVVFAELVRWYGVAALVLAFLLYKGLRSSDWAVFRTVLEVLLVGDLFKIGVVVLYILNTGSYSFAIYFTILGAFFLAIVRVLVLRKPDMLG